METLQTTRKFKGTCGHGHDTTMDIHLPLTVEILDCTDEFSVWLRSGREHYVTTVAHMDCEANAILVLDAFNLLLATPEGQESAIDFIKHDLQLEEVTN